MAEEIKEKEYLAKLLKKIDDKLYEIDQAIRLMSDEVHMFVILLLFDSILSLIASAFFYEAFCDKLNKGLQYL